MTVIPELDCNLAHLARTLRKAGHRYLPPAPFGPRGVAVRLVDGSGGHMGTILASEHSEDDGVEWIHASISWESRMPTYEDLALLKRAVFGPAREAYQVFPTEDRHINIHARALHLWGRADGRQVLPDFGRWGTI